jgi:PilZ domain
MRMDASNCQNRRSRRSQVLLTAEIEHAGATQSVKLRNMSADGALVESNSLPIEGTPVVFCRKELCVQGKIVWVNGHFAGIAFNSKLNPEQVLRHIPAPRPKVQPRAYRPGFTPRSMTSEQQRLAESWIWSPGTNRPGE